MKQGAECEWTDRQTDISPFSIVYLTGSATNIKDRLNLKERYFPQFNFLFKNIIRIFNK